MNDKSEPVPVPLSQADKSPEAALHVALRDGNGDAGDTPEHTTAPCGEPAAWYVLRVAPGMRDDGMRLGPFWRREDAESWADEQHVVVPLFGAAEVLRLQALLRTVADAFDDWQKPTPGAGREWCERFSTYLRGAVVATASFTSEEWAEVEKWMTPRGERRPSSLAAATQPVSVPASEPLRHPYGEQHADPAP